MKHKPLSKDYIRGYTDATMLELSTNAKWTTRLLKLRGRITRMMFGRKR